MVSIVKQRIVRVLETICKIKRKFPCLQTFLFFFLCEDCDFSDLNESIF